MSLNLVAQLRSIVGQSHVLTRPGATRAYCTGYRAGGGSCLCAVRPGTLLEFWRVLQACAAADTVILIQAANTGLTGGSTPDGDYDRPVVVISTLRLQRINILGDGEQVLCHAGATLHALERLLAPMGREPHSVIGSSCIGASVVGGICNNSGGSLVRRGPAYTELALYARIGDNGTLSLVNHLSLDLGATPEEMLTRLGDPDFQPELGTADGLASDQRYAADVRNIDADTPARFNADPRRLFEASGSAGKVAVFAVRLDTFPSETSARTFYVGTNDPAELTALRRMMLGGNMALPIAAEYLHGDAFDLADRYGRDMFQAIRAFGTDRLPALYRLQNRFNALAERLPGSPANLSDRVLQRLSRLMGDHLPGRIRDFRSRFAHHLLLKVSANDAHATAIALNTSVKDATGDHFLCTDDEATKAFLHRFVTAGAAVRYRNVHSQEVEDILSLDIALRRNDTEWFETLPPEIEAQIIAKVYYGHFFCHVLHQDYVLRKGANLAAIKRAMLERLDARGAEYPAEHNVGHQYHAKPSLAAHYRKLDPLNRFNPGIGRLTKAFRWTQAKSADEDPEQVRLGRSF